MSTAVNQIALIERETVCVTGSGRAGRIAKGVYPVVGEIEDTEGQQVAYLQVGDDLYIVSATDDRITFATPGEPFNNPDLPAEMTEGFVVGECGHRVAGSEWAAGFRSCERCAA